MQKNQRIILYLLILIASASWMVISADPSATTTNGQTAAPQAGFMAPDISLESLNGETYTLSELRGQAVLVNLWATWCPPCRAEMPAIEKIYNEYKDQGLIVLAVNMTYQDEPSAVAPFVAEYGLTFPVLLDRSGASGAAYQLRSLPSSYFIDRKGSISEVVIGGPMSEALLRARVEQILR